MVGRPIVKWVKDDTVPGGSIRKIQFPDGYHKDKSMRQGPVVNGGVQAEIEAETDMSTVDSDDDE